MEKTEVNKMSRVAIPVASIGNEFVLRRNQVHMTAPVMASEVAMEPVAASPVAAAVPLQEPRDFSPPAGSAAADTSSPEHLIITLFHRHSLAVFALLFLLVGSTGIEVAGKYWSAHVVNAVKPAAALASTAHTIAGLNLTVPSNQLQAELRTITSQPATLAVGTQTVPISADTIHSWLQITASADKSQDYIHIKPGTITASLNQLANQFAKAPVNQVTVAEGGTSQVVVAGQNGAALSDPASLKTQAQQFAKTVMNAKGLQFSTPLQTVPFQAVTPVAFGKLLDVNVTTKQMYAYQAGQLVQTFAVSAGAPDTPTPLGEFHIWEKLTSQTMTGFNPNGTKYVQPNVPWINYFDHSGDAVHGNYWRPASVFGAVNTSHGCVSVPVSEGEWIYDWAPVGTTVITHA